MASSARIASSTHRASPHWPSQILFSQSRRPPNPRRKGRASSVRCSGSYGLVGVGGGGNNAVHRVAGIGLQGVDFYVMNSDAQALLNSEAKNPLQIGELLARRLGSNDLLHYISSSSRLDYSILASQKRISSFSFAKAFVLANAWMFAFPFDVLAETCEGDGSLFNMPLLLGVALIGATVGGLLARQRKGELKRLNDQLRQINAALRRQAKIESYAPNLSYAPVGRVPEAEVIVDPRKQEIIANLRTGKNYLRNQEPEKAFTDFKVAIELAQALGDHVEEKKAARGLGASLQRQGKYKDAIKYHSRVLEISKKTGEDSGTTEAYGAIADCYTELGDLERAGKFYDKYIARLETD